MNRNKNQRRGERHGRKAEGGRRSGDGARQARDFFSGSQLSALSSQLSPRGITLTEVLISMGILTLGLLGVAALFPVGGFYMQKAEIADNGSAIAQSALADIVARGMLDPDTWRVFND